MYCCSINVIATSVVFHPIWLTELIVHIIAIGEILIIIIGLSNHAIRGKISFSSQINDIENKTASKSIIALGKGINYIWIYLIEYLCMIILFVFLFCQV